MSIIGLQDSAKVMDVIMERQLSFTGRFDILLARSSELYGVVQICGYIGERDTSAIDLNTVEESELLVLREITRFGVFNSASNDASVSLKLTSLDMDEPKLSNDIIQSRGPGSISFVKGTIVKTLGGKERNLAVYPYWIRVPIRFEDADAVIYYGNKATVELYSRKDFDISTINGPANRGSAFSGVTHISSVDMTSIHSTNMVVLGARIFRFHKITSQLIPDPTVSSIAATRIGSLTGATFEHPDDLNAGGVDGYAAGLTILDKIVGRKHGLGLIVPYSPIVAVPNVQLSPATLIDQSNRNVSQIDFDDHSIAESIKFWDMVFGSDVVINEKSRAVDTDYRSKLGHYSVKKEDYLVRGGFFSPGYYVIYGAPNAGKSQLAGYIQASSKWVDESGKPSSCTARLIELNEASVISGTDFSQFIEALYDPHVQVIIVDSVVATILSLPGAAGVGGISISLYPFNEALCQIAMRFGKVIFGLFNAASQNAFRDLGDMLSAINGRSEITSADRRSDDSKLRLFQTMQGGTNGIVAVGLGKKVSVERYAILATSLRGQNFRQFVVGGISK